MTKSLKLDEGAAVLLGAAAFKDILSRDPDACILGAIVSQQSETVEGEHTRREQDLDNIHAQIEATPRPNEPVNMTLYTPEGKRITYDLDSLNGRRKKTPSERERRRMLGLELADFLTAGGL